MEQGADSSSGQLMEAFEMAAVAALSALGIAANLRAVLAIRRRFDVSKVVFFLLYLDAVTSFGSSVLLLGTSLVLTVEKSYPTCSALFILLSIPNFGGLIMTAEVAIIR